MVHTPDGGPSHSTPTGVGYKLDVKVESLRVLADQIADDLKDFDDEFERWNQQSRLSHPRNAQFLRKEGNKAPFDEAIKLDGSNGGSHLQVEFGAQLLRKGLEALQKGADNLAKTYKNLDEANALSVSQVQWLFPQPKKPDGSAGGVKLPSAEEMQKKLLPGGFDLDGDGKIDPTKGDIAFAPSASGKKPEFSNDTSKNDRPTDDRADLHLGYERPVDESKQSQETGGFSDEVREEYQEQLAEDAEVQIVAPGAPGTAPSSGPPSGAVTA